MELRKQWVSPIDSESLPLLLVGAGLSILYGPTFFSLSKTIWGTEQQGHGPIILAVCCWLLWRDRGVISGRVDVSPKSIVGALLVGIAGLIYVIGRSQEIYLFEVGSLPIILSGLILIFRGSRQLRALAFPLVFLIFMVPLPSSIVDSLTQPMKIFVSFMADNILHSIGYPVSRTGVVLQIGNYQLLVADACAGLQSLFTLEALGLLYLNSVRHASIVRNVGLAILIIPISMTANIIRVVILCLITYYYGDEVGQGFLHGFSGMVLFMSALALTIAADSLLRLAKPDRLSHV